VSEATKDQIKVLSHRQEYEPGIRRGTVHASSRSWRSLDQDSSSWWRQRRRRRLDVRPAGQNFGYTLLWTLPLLIPVLIVNQEMWYVSVP